MDRELMTRRAETAKKISKKTDGSALIARGIATPSAGSTRAVRQAASPSSQQKHTATAAKDGPETITRRCA
eukprot:2797270-Alexandrium_andersonii.AAC.1